jgi:hypothetical protein
MGMGMIVATIAVAVTGLAGGTIHRAIHDRRAQRDQDRD